MSMGGMIAQRMTLLAPQRVRTLTSVMSSSGARYLPGPRADVVQALIARPGRSEEAIVNHIVRLFRLIGSPAYPIPEETLRDYARASVRRSYRPAGTARQMLAITADTRRADELPRIKRPTLVLHGRDDPLVPLACGIDTARRIAGARLHVIDGMGHDLAPGVLELLLPRLCEHLMEERRG